MLKSLEIVVGYSTKVVKFIGGAAHSSCGLKSFLMLILPKSVVRFRGLNREVG